jgi:hypothetical protein
MQATNVEADYTKLFLDFAQLALQRGDKENAKAFIYILAKRLSRGLL